MKRFDSVFTFAVAMAIICCAGSVKAQQEAKPVALTPTALYDMFEVLQKRVQNHAVGIGNVSVKAEALRQRVQELEDLRSKQEERNSKTLKVLLDLNQRVQELERKKADASALQETRDQVANMFVMLRKKQ